MKKTLKHLLNSKKRLLLICIAALLIIAAVFLIIFLTSTVKDDKVNEELSELKNTSAPAASIAPAASVAPSSAPDTTPPEVLAEYAELSAINESMVGWLKIDGTIIDYPVVQTPEDENYYLKRDFYGNKSSSGTLIMDTDSTVGGGTAAAGYNNGSAPSTNLIIHGHNMRSGAMFGDLELYEDEFYGIGHRRIYFDSLYEKREYELIAVFRSKVFYKHEQVFKFYNFFNADTEEEFDYWYDNIKSLALYDTGVTAEFGDEFLTLSTCAYHTEDGRLVVVAKRIK